MRGAKIATRRKAKKQIKKSKQGPSDIFLAGLPMLKDFEIQHTLICGASGAGKSQLFFQLLEQIRSRGDSAIILDNSCSFVPLFFREESDAILNPGDARCASWDLWREATTKSDLQTLASSLIPDTGESEPFWNNGARTVFVELAEKLRGRPDRSLQELLRLMMCSSLKELSGLLEGTPAGRLTNELIDKTAESIRGVLASKLACLEALGKGGSGNPFSVREWVQQAAEADKSRFLFISSTDKQLAEIRPLISAWTSLACSALLSLSQERSRRIWVICDELPSLQKLPRLSETLAQVRKFGGCFVLGLQAFSQLETVYGRTEADTILEGTNTKFVFRMAGSQGSRTASALLGNADIERPTESYSYGQNTVRDGISLATQRLSVPLVSPSEIQEMKDLVAYFKVGAAIPVAKLAVRYRKRVPISLPIMLKGEQATSPPLVWRIST